MQHTNDDIDELYRNAADDYPLKIKGADWDSIAGRIGRNNDAEAPVVPIGARTSNKKYRYLLLLLLLPAAFLAVKHTTVSTGTDNSAVAVRQSADKSNSPVANLPVQPVTISPSNELSSSDGSNHTPYPSGTTTKESATGTKGNAAIATTAYSNVTSKNTGIKSMAVKTPVINMAEQPGNENNVTNTLTPSAAVTPLSQSGIITKQKEVTDKLNNQYPTPASINSNSPIQLQAKQDVPNSNAVVSSLQPGVKDKLIKPNTGRTASIAKGEGEGKGKINEPVQKPLRKHLYIGAFISPDYTTIKYQAGDKVGFNFGGLIGYKFTRDLSLEVGIAVDKKYYTSDGKYYNTANQKWIESAGKLLNISGSSSLTEFPVNVVYSFKPGRDGNFFVSGGMVSYIVHEENYNYEFDKNGYIYNREKSTKKGTINAFANFNISAGYESSLGHGINFRVEPYYRIPIKGIGLGGLPITSVGLNIGIVKMIK